MERSSTPGSHLPVVRASTPRVPAFRQGPGMPEDPSPPLLNLLPAALLGPVNKWRICPGWCQHFPVLGPALVPSLGLALVLEISCGSPELLTGCIPNKESDLGTTDAPESRIGTKMPLSPGCPTSDSTGLNQMYYLTPQAKTSTCWDSVSGISQLPGGGGGTLNF